METSVMPTLKLSDSAKEIAGELLRLGAVQLNVKEPFTWVSGIKAPVYCDNRRINSDVQARQKVADAFATLIQKEFPQAQMIAGVATGGIPFGVLAAERLNLPFIYVRQSAKGHGLQKQVEGLYTAGDKTVVIEDHISTGGSSMKAVQALREENLYILGLVSVMTYGLKKAADLFSGEKVAQYSLCDLDTALEVAHASGRISSADRDAVSVFRDNL